MITVKNSPLVWQDFALLELQFETISPSNTKEDFDPNEYYAAYPIAADFAIQDHEEYIQVFFKTEINATETPLPGYKLFCIAMGVFTLNDGADLPDEQLNNLKSYSTLNLVINRLRHHIRNITAESAFGPYEYPTIDINELFQQKRNQE